MIYSAQFYPDEGGAPIDRPAIPAASFEEAVTFCKGLARGYACSRFVLSNQQEGSAILFTDAGVGWDEEDAGEG
jgi:hypothetical protein